MIAAEIIRTATAAGITLAARGDQLSVTPAIKLSADLRAVLIANKALLIEHLSKPANEPAPRCRAWRIRFRDGSGATAVNTTGADHTEMLLIVREQFGAERVACVEVAQ